MFILIVANGYPTKKNPLIGIFPFDQAMALQKAGHKVVFLSLDLRSFRRVRKLGKYQLIKDQIEIYNISLPIGRVPAPIFYHIGNYAVRFVFKDIEKKHGSPDIVHAHFTDIASVASIFKIRYKIPFIITEHSSSLNQDILSRKTRYFCQRSYLYADQLIVVSKSLSERVREHFGLYSKIVNNIVDVDSFRFGPNDHEFFTFVSVGNLKYNKGFDLLINAFAGVRHMNYKLIIIGKGPQYNTLLKQIQLLELTGTVTLAGGKTRKEINNIMSNCDVFVLSSRGETFGVVYIEAMAAGLPVIATKCGGPEEFVNDTNGLLISPNDTEQLIKALISIRENYAIYDRERISEYSRKRFSPDVIAAKLTDIYYECLESGKIAD